MSTPVFSIYRAHVQPLQKWCHHSNERALFQSADLAYTVTSLCFIYCILMFFNRSLKKGIRGSHWGVIMDKSNHVIFVWAFLWQQHSLVMCPLRFDWTNSFHLMVLSVSVKCVYKWKSIFAPPGESICSSFVSANCDESSKSCFRGSNSKDTKTPRIVCIYNPRSLHVSDLFSPHLLDTTLT